MTEKIESWELPELRAEAAPKPGTPAPVRGGDTLQQVREHARRAGHEAGLEEGRAQAMEEAAHELAQARQARVEAEGAVACLREAVEQLKRADALSVEAAGREAVELAYRLCEQILEREVTRDGAVLAACEKAVGLLAVREGVSLRVNPAEVEVVREAVGETARVIPDPMVLPGGCVAEAGSARVDMRWEAALVRVRESLSLPPI